MKTVGHRRYVAALLPMNRDMTIDEQAYRRFIRHFVDDKDFYFNGEGVQIIHQAAAHFALF